MTLPTSFNLEEDKRLYLIIENVCPQLISLKVNFEVLPYFLTIEEKLSPQVKGKYIIIKNAENDAF
jgi:hypothetical protein